jgi:glyoxylase-like metal-dependent hydrolase (beta-lactamase superfamily II)
MSTETQRWPVGHATITSIVEDEIAHIPPELFFPAATATEVAEHPWVLEHWADADGNIALRVQALVIEIGDRRVLVDPCVGNGKDLPLPFWANQSWPFMERFADAGFAPEDVDTVVHTHLHADHVGWDTRRDGDTWVPTFPHARHLYTAAELAWARANADAPMHAFAFRDSISPILDAGLAEEVAPDADLDDGMRLEPTPGHTPGHVSLWLESDGEHALITGDFLHHPVQCAVPDWAEVGDEDADLARETRRRLLRTAAESGALVIGTHFPARPAGRVVADAVAWRFLPA